MASLFANAKTVNPVKATKKSSTKNEVQIDGLKQLAEIDALMKALTAAKTTLEQSVKSDAFDHFFNEAQETAKRPDNFRGIDGYASASVEMRKRATTSALSDEEVKMFEKYDLEVEKVVAVQKLFAINPSYASDDKLLQKVEEAIAQIVPVDFIVVQEEKSKNVVGEATIDKAFSSKAPREIIEAITVMAIKPKLETTDIGEIINSVKTLLV
jgi:hypothetical protein